MQGGERLPVIQISAEQITDDGEALIEHRAGEVARRRRRGPVPRMRDERGEDVEQITPAIAVVADQRIQHLLAVRLETTVVTQGGHETFQRPVCDAEDAWPVASGRSAGKLERGTRRSEQPEDVVGARPEDRGHTAGHALDDGIGQRAGSGRDEQHHVGSSPRAHRHHARRARSGDDAVRSLVRVEHEPVTDPGRRVEPESPEACRDVLLAGEARAEEIVDKAPMREHGPRALSVGEAAEREGRRAQLHDGGTAGGMRGTVACDEPAPAHTAGLHRHAVAVARTRRREGFADRDAEGFDRDHLARGVLQVDGGVERAGDLRHDHIGGRAPQTEGGEEIVQTLTLAQRLRLRLDQGAMHGLGHRDELDLCGERDESETGGGARLDDRLRNAGHPGAELDDDARDPDGRELGHEGTELCRCGRPGRARREQQFSAVEEAGDSGAVRDVDPAHARVERAPTDEHRRHAPLYRRKREHVRDAQQRGLTFRTICPTGRRILTL